MFSYIRQSYIVMFIELAIQDKINRTRTRSLDYMSATMHTVKSSDKFVNYSH